MTEYGITASTCVDISDSLFDRFLAIFKLYQPFVGLSKLPRGGFLYEIQIRIGHFALTFCHITNRVDVNKHQSE